MRPTLLSIGHGYSATALGRRLLADGWRVIGTSRSREGCARIAESGAEPVLWDGGAANEALLAGLGAASHLLSSVAPGEDGDPVLAALGATIAKAAPRLAWAGYLSTTGVYGDRQGGWVDERSPCSPGTRRGQLRLRAERDWHALHREAGLRLHRFRLAGIYGSGRGPFAKVRAGTARRIVKPGQVFSRIHVEDIATALAGSIARPCPGAVFNLCDDLAAPPEDVIAHAARLLELPLPPAVPIGVAALSPMAASFYAESKRVSNRRARHELGWRPAYPSYREGLAALLAAERAGAPA